MIKLDLRLGLVATVCLTALLTAAPTYGYFQSRNHTSTEGTSSGTGGFVLRTSASGNLAVVCNDVKDIWTIQALTKQEATTKGAHLQLKLKYEGKVVSKTQSKNCETTFNGSPFGQAVPYATRIQIKQSTLGQTKDMTATIEEPIQTEDIATGCKITVPTKGNEKLEKVSAANVGTSGIKLTPEIKGVTIVVNAICEALGIKGGKEGEITLEKGAEDLEEGIELV